MAHTATEIPVPTRRSKVTTPDMFWSVLAVAVVGVVLISLPNLRDPMMRYDDFPALLADPSGFWAKTLHEGRWINYLWHLREIVTPAWLNFAVYQLLWATFAAVIAVAAVGPNRSAWFAAVLALMIIIAPPATLISLWFNTLIPGLGIVAVYGVMGLRLTQFSHRAFMPVFVVLSFMAYTTYPVLILALCLVQSRQRSLLDLAGVLGLFVLSFAAAVLIVYAINFQVHGIFGVPLADWRDAAPAEDIAGMLGNAHLVWSSLSDLMIKSSFGFAPAIWFHLGMLTAATAILLRTAPHEALYLHAGLWMGMALVVVQILKLGVIVPPRTFIFAWVFYAVIAVRGAQCLSVQIGLPGRMGRNFVLLIVASYMLQTFQQYTSYRAWQAETRALANIVGRESNTVRIIGDVLSLPSAQQAAVQNELALTFRVRQIAGKTVDFCKTQTTCAVKAEDENAPTTYTFLSVGVSTAD